MIADVYEVPESAPENKFEFVVIAYEKAAQAEVRKAGLLGVFDIYARPAKMSISLSREPDFARDLPEFKALLESKGLVVAAIFVPGTPEGSYVDPLVRDLVFANQFISMKKALEELGYKAE